MTRLIIAYMVLAVSCNQNQKLPETIVSGNTLASPAADTIQPDTLAIKDNWMPEKISTTTLDAHGPVAWTTIEEGIDFIEIDSAIWVFRIDPAVYRFSAVYGNKEPLTSWVVGKTGGINLGMFHDGENPSGYTKVAGKVIQPKHNKKYNLYMVWDDNDFKIFDRTKVAMATILAYPNVSQNIRMITPEAPRNRWDKDEKYWSAATIATTRDGKVLFIHSRRPHRMHDFVNILLAHDEQLAIEYMLYTEGGPESGIIIRGNGIDELPFKRVGSFETGFWETDSNDSFWPLPFAMTFVLK